MSEINEPQTSESEEIMRTALEKLRLYGSSWWRESWGTPSKVANDALNEADRAQYGDA
jgi:hypothetical protein